MADIRSFFGGGGGKPTKPNSSSNTKPEKKKEKKHSIDSNNASSTKKLSNGDAVKKKKRIIIDSDSDEDPLPSKLRKEKSSNGDDEDPIPPTPEIKKKEKHKEKNSSDQLAKPPVKKPDLNPTTAMDFFSSSSAQPTSAPIKRKKEKHSEIDEPPSKKEKKIETSEPLSKVQKSPVKAVEVEKQKSAEKGEQIRKNDNDAEKGKKLSLASKLSSKVKEGDGFMNAVKESGKPKDGKSTEKIKHKDREGTDKVKHKDREGTEKIKTKPTDDGSNNIKSSVEEVKMKESLKGYISQAKEKEKKEKTRKEITETTPTKSPSTSKTPPAKTPPANDNEKTTEDGETPVEKKNKSYWSYKSREGPSALGSKQLPVGGENCLEGLSFVITGVLEAFNREEVVDYIKRYGGKVVTAVSGKTSYLILGREPGESKLTKAEQHGTKKLDEDGFIELVESKSPATKKSSENVSPKKSKESSGKVKTEHSSKDKSKSSSKISVETKTPPAKTPPTKTPPTKTPPTKTPSSKTPAAEVDLTSEESETPKTAKKNYWAYKAREGPSALGTKTLPVGGENCLAGLAFVISGVLEAFDREEVIDYIKRYGGKVTGAVSGKTDYLILGREPGESKLVKAEKHGTKKLDEDGFIELVTRKSPAIKKNTSSPVKASPMAIKKESPKVKQEKTDYNKKSVMDDGKAVLDRLKGITPGSSFKIPIKGSPSSGSDSRKSTPSSTPNTQSPVVKKESGSSILWVEKYKPKTMKQIVGQQGAMSNANKLKTWLKNWQENNAPGSSKKKSKDDGSMFKAALLSGPPGVGKTTTATLVCQEMGFSYVEMNASDTRGKKALETEIKASLSNITVNGMIDGKNNSGRNHVLIMDEVDGMAGNEDRGGMQELIALVKKSQIPIICMCNDRNSQKIRSLANYVFDLRCYKPRVEQIKGFALSVAAKEGLKIPPQAMEQIVVGTNQDIRQVLHNLQMWTSTDKSMDYDQSKEHAKEAHKNIKIDNFEIVRKLFSRSEASSMTVNDRVGYFFNDYSFVPLFMQENYIHVNPSQGGGNVRTILETMSKAADSISDGNHLEKILRSKQAWKLLPMHAMYSTVIPSMVMSGYLGQRIEFPKWLGKNSTTNKHDRILQELKTHMALSANCMKSDVNLDYLPILKHRLTRPLLDTTREANVVAKDVISFMDDYNFSREDWDSIVDISKWGNEPDITTKIPSKVKSAFTRLYNKESHKTPYAIHQAAKRQKGTASVADSVLMDDEDAVAEKEDDEEEKEDITKDAMIKVKNEKPATSSKSKTAKGKTSDSKGKVSGSSSSGKKKK